MKDWTAARGVAVGLVLGLLALVVAPGFDSMDMWHETVAGMPVTTRKYLLPDHWRLLLFFAALVAAGGASVLRQSPIRWAIGIVGGVMCAWIIRVVLDLRVDPTNHNLLPFEGGIDLVMLLVATVPAAFIGGAVARATDRQLSRWSPSWRKPK